jgi:hypothetical protein
LEPTVTREQALALEHVELLAWRDLREAATVADRDGMGMRSAEIAGAFAMATSATDSLIENRVLGLGLREPATDDIVKSVLANYPRDGSFAVNLCPFARPADAAEVLARHGFATFFHHLKWVRDDSAVAPVETSLDVIAIGAERAHEWEHLYATVHDLPPSFATWASRAVGRAHWTHVLALDGGQPVAAAAMFASDGHAWLGMMGTRESHRRRGAQGALLAARVRAGLEAGVHTFAIETGPDGPERPGGSLRNAARAGFRRAYERPSWVYGLKP